MFIVGAVILVLETLGALLLAPYFGTSVTTWSALIITTLAALAVGAAFGGLLADRKKPRAALSFLFFGAGLWLMIVPSMRGFILPTLTGLGLKFGALVAAFLLLFAPLAALGAATPLVVRLVVNTVGETGRVYGFVSSVATLGGVVGALASGFWLLPHWPIGVVLFGAAAVLVLAGIAVRVTVP